MDLQAPWVVLVDRARIDRQMDGTIDLSTSACSITLVMQFICTEVDRRHCDSTCTAGGGEIDYICSVRY